MPQKITDAEKAAYLDRTNELFNRVKNGTLLMSPVLAGLQKLIEGDFGSKVVNLDADPFAPDGMSVEEHKKGGMLDFDSAKIALYLSEEQKGGKRIVGNKLREELKAQPVYNANLLDWYLRKENQHLIPEGWKGKIVFFWGTIYRYSDGGLCVRCLYWLGGRWDWSYGWLDSGWYSGNPAAVLAS